MDLRGGEGWPSGQQEGQERGTQEVPPFPGMRNDNSFLRMVIAPFPSGCG
jgi:hypothetical protein